MFFSLFHLQYFPDHFVRKDIFRMVIACVNCNRGCQWTGKYSELKVRFLHNYFFWGGGWDESACQALGKFIHVAGDRVYLL